MFQKGISANPTGGRPRAAAPKGIVCNKNQWISRQRAADELGVTYFILPKVATVGKVRTKTIPGIKGCKFYLPDIERIKQESIQQAGTANHR